MAIIKREDGAYFTGQVADDGAPYEAYGPYATVEEAQRKESFARVAHAGVMWPDAEEQDFDEAHPDATVWSTQNGDAEDIASWGWEVVGYPPYSA